MKPILIPNNSPDSAKGKLQEIIDVLDPAIKQAEGMGATVVMGVAIPSAQADASEVRSYINGNNLYILSAMLDIAGCLVPSDFKALVNLLTNNPSFAIHRAPDVPLDKSKVN